MLDLRTHHDSYITRMHNAPIGASCIHTGITVRKGQRVRSCVKDAGLKFINYGHHAELITGEESPPKDAIFGLNDLIEVLPTGEVSNG